MQVKTQSWALVTCRPTDSNTGYKLQVLNSVSFFEAWNCVFVAGRKVYISLKPTLSKFYCVTSEMICGWNVHSLFRWSAMKCNDRSSVSGFQQRWNTMNRASHLSCHTQRSVLRAGCDVQMLDDMRCHNLYRTSWWVLHVRRGRRSSRQVTCSLVWIPSI
jgi:hypothetical protein